MLCKGTVLQSLCWWTAMSWPHVHPPLTPGPAQSHGQAHRLQLGECLARGTTFISYPVFYCTSSMFKCLDTNAYPCVPAAYSIQHSNTCTGCQPRSQGLYQAARWAVPRCAGGPPIQVCQGLCDVRTVTSPKGASLRMFPGVEGHMTVHS